MDKVKFQLKVNSIVESEFNTQKEAIEAAQNRNRSNNWIEVISPEGRQVFAEREFTHSDHVRAAQSIIEQIKGSDSSMPSDSVIDHLNRTVSVCEDTLLKLPGSGGYQGIKLTRYQCIATPHVAGCNKHFYVISAGYGEGYIFELYESSIDAFKALEKHLGTAEIPLYELFELSRFT